jgi:hypothetical protein
MNHQHVLRVAARLLPALTLIVAACGKSTVIRPPAEPGAGGAPGNAPGATPSPPPTEVPTFTLPDAAALPGGGAAVLDAAPCQPLACMAVGGKYCGTIGDGCGRTLDCGADCPAGLTCGGGGVRGLCGAPRDPACLPIACVQPGGRLCGQVGDGCGGGIDCGGCPDGASCGAVLANVCGSGPGGPAACDNLCQQQVTCPGGGETTVSGTVFAPTPAAFGVADPLYNVLVYVPNAPVQAFTPGVACDQCGEVSGRPLVNALTGPDGKFVLRRVPVGNDIPLVIQIGRWRRQIEIPRVTACTDTPLPAEQTRLPRNKLEGDIPQFAIATGVYDPMDCLLRKIGIADSEFTLPTGTGRVHMFAFGGNTLGAGTPSGDTLVGSAATLARYDMVLLPCDDQLPKPRAQQQALRDYVDKGGRMFLTDWSYSWLRDGAMGSFERTVTWKPTATLQGQDFVGVLDTSFPKGMAFSRWLQEVMAAGPMPGQIRIHDPYSGASNVDAVIPPTQRWIYTMGTTAARRTVQHFTFNTPIGAAADKQCGRVVFSQFHVAESDTGPVIIAPELTFPRACDNRPMTPQEKALEFMLFDASACVQPDVEPPRVFQPPPPHPPPPPPLVD